MSLTSSRPRAFMAALTAGAAVSALVTAPEAVAEPLAQAVAPALSESFDGPGLPAGWTPVEGSWKVQDGRLVGTSANSGQQSRITFGTPLTDFRIESRLRFESALDGGRWVALGLDVAPSGAVPWSIATLRNGSTAANGLEFAQRTAANTWTTANPLTRSPSPPGSTNSAPRSQAP